MRYRKWIPIGLGAALIVFMLATGGKVLAQGTAGDLAKILEAGLDGLKAYFDWLLEVLKVIW